MIQKNIDKIIIGTALTVAASALLPIAKSTLQPITEAGIQGSGGLLTRVRSLLQIAREEVEDIIAEAQFERMKKQLDREIALLDDEVKSHDE
ncbi:DUF5132 domain-containing protein [Paenibacillus planticolens]|uniref:DUF5132 domain-containing protein n=1 Tax=Paenibacillus planticolens TaxID=2654976 RepID=A0ABX2A015_9BACL|nr:DUF5132 domain-containing protein [Paenibacillus planticolens]NOV04338.1 DUF5132 domain-containing protein [Paenibacillus planticolens]